MTERQWSDVRLAANYLLSMVVSVMLAGGAALLAQLQAGGPVDWSPILAAALAALLMALRGMTLPQVGTAPSLSKGDVGRIADALIDRQAKTVASRSPRAGTPSAARREVSQ